MTVLERVRLDSSQLPDATPAATSQSRALCRTIGGWLWPESLQSVPHPGNQIRNHADHMRFSQAYCDTAQQRQWVATAVADNLATHRHDLPKEVVEHICTFVACYG
jgi:hypothetical protein